MDKLNSWDRRKVSIIFRKLLKLYDVSWPTCLLYATGSRTDYSDVIVFKGAECISASLARPHHRRASHSCSLFLPHSTQSGVTTENGWQIEKPLINWRIYSLYINGRLRNLELGPHYPFVCSNPLGLRGCGFNESLCFIGGFVSSVDCSFDVTPALAAKKKRKKACNIHKNDHHSARKWRSYNFTQLSGVFK